MKSIKHIYKIGTGPSSSHSMGPRKAAELFVKRLRDKNCKIEVELYGSLAATGKGHLTDKAIVEGSSPLKVKIIWKKDQSLPLHPNGMVFKAVDSNGQTICNWRVYSVGGGELLDDNGPIQHIQPSADCTYQLNSISEILAWCIENDKSFWQYCLSCETEGIWHHLSQVWQVMCDSICRGLSSKQEYLPGSLRLKHKAGAIFKYAHEHVGIHRDFNLLSAYALAIAEENAVGHKIVTAPTCGSSGVLPSVLYYFHKHNNIGTDQILQALATAGLFGSSVAERASISGAQVGCQGEIGTASAMSASAAAQLLGADCKQIEYAAEIALEHSLGLTCDPVSGLVQVPCIERNAFAAMRAVECATYALSTSGEHIVSFDDVVNVMYRTGKDLQAKYRETSAGGLADIMRLRLIDKQ
jgi:L-serine dehydratase